MLGLVVCVLVVGAALSMTVHQSRLRKADREVELAARACRNNLEELRSVDIATLATMDGAGFDVPGPDGQVGGLTPVAGDLDGLVGEFSVTVEETTGPDTLYRVTATARWTGALVQQSFALTTLMGERL